MAEDEGAPGDPALPEKLDRVRVEKADGCVFEYHVRGLRLEYIGVPAEHRKPGEAMGSLELEADEVFAHRQCGVDEESPTPGRLDHLTLRVRDLAASRAFYEAALAGLDYAVRLEFPGVVGMGPPGRPYLWLAEEPDGAGRTHLAITARERGQVDAFHAAALEAGGTDHGPPGERPHYHPGYYAAFVLDPDGNNLEVVFHTPSEGESKGDEEE